MNSNRFQSPLFIYGFRLLIIVTILFFMIPAGSQAQVSKVSVVSDATGRKLQVDGKDFMINGMNWDYFPIGKTYTYSFWTQPDDIIKAGLDREMSLLKNMGVNAIRLYTGVQPRWVQYIYENYGIYTMLNHSFGRYGVTLDGVYIENTDYADPRTKEFLIAEVEAMANEFKGVPGVLLYLLGNENNYGLFWGGAETEDIPDGETLESVRARHMYKRFNEGIKAIKAITDDRPVAICNGDLLFIDIIAEEVTEMDIFGTNMYRGLTFTDAFDRVKEKLDVPIMFTEFGADAYNAIELREDQTTQARYLHANWRDIYEHAAGKGKTGVSIGGFTFQFTDGWWKFGQETNLDMHDNNASWANGGYVEDYEEGENNMNEEWFGICNKGPTDFRGLYEVYPRAAYYVLKEVHMLDVYDPGTTLDMIGKHFDAIELMPAVLNARSDNAMRIADDVSRIRVSNIRMEFETFNTDGSLISTPSDDNPQEEYPSFLGFDHLQSFYTDFAIKPADNVTAKLSVNILGNVPVNPIDEVFYENRGRRQNFVLDGEPLPMDDLERVKVYGASVSWEDRWFSLNGFYRVGHTHWGYDGDFFGIYRNAFYGENLDIYNGIAPIGIEIAGKKDLDGLTVAYGPELWWGANPAIIVKYQRTIATIDITAFYQNEFAQRSESVSSIAVPLPATKRATLALEKKWGLQDLGTFGIQVGGIWAGSTLKGRTFQIAEGPDDNVMVQQDKVKDEDTFGGKVKVTWQFGRWNWYAQYAYAGIVANGGPDETTTFTKWTLKDHGLGNGNLVSSGIAVNLGNFQVAPNFMWQKPLVGPIPSNAQAPGRPRNVIDDPFAVRANREMIAGEIMFSHDPTPATWMWEWNNDIQEDAKLAWSIGYVFRHFPTTMDAAIGILQDGRTFFAFPGATPARDLWEVKSRIVSKLSNDSRLVAHLFVGTGEPNGDDPRLIERYGGDLRITYGSAALQTFFKVNDWGPYDYHRDFNLTFPVHLMGDLSYSLGTPRWFGLPQTRVGVKFTWRSLDQYSNRYCPTKTIDETGELACDPEVPGFEDGTEWEIRTYLHIDLGM